MTVNFSSQTFTQSVGNGVIRYTETTGTMEVIRFSSATQTDNKKTAEKKESKFPQIPDYQVKPEDKKEAQDAKNEFAAMGRERKNLIHNSNRLDDKMYDLDENSDKYKKLEKKQAGYDKKAEDIEKASDAYKRLNATTEYSDVNKTKKQLAQYMKDINAMKGDYPNMASMAQKVYDHKIAELDKAQNAKTNQPESFLSKLYNKVMGN